MPSHRTNLLNLQYGIIFEKTQQSQSKEQRRDTREQNNQPIRKQYNNREKPKLEQSKRKNKISPNNYSQKLQKSNLPKPNFQKQMDRDYFEWGANTKKWYYFEEKKTLGNTRVGRREKIGNS